MACLLIWFPISILPLISEVNTIITARSVNPRSVSTRRNTWARAQEGRCYCEADRKLLEIKAWKEVVPGSRRQGCSSRLDPRASKVNFVGHPYLFSSSDLDLQVRESLDAYLQQNGPIEAFMQLIHYFINFVWFSLSKKCRISLPLAMHPKLTIILRVL